MKYLNKFYTGDKPRNCSLRELRGIFWFCIKGIDKTDVPLHNSKNILPKNFILQSEDEDRGEGEEEENLLRQTIILYQYDFVTKVYMMKSYVLDIRIWLNPPIIRIAAFLFNSLTLSQSIINQMVILRIYFEFQEIDVYSFLVGPGGRCNFTKYESLMFYE
ncbi:hypothetical protein RCL_jg9700.t3 [Rhizophagus clarus]|uniref:Uncharacterized protein n=1 Tax=Rhizophagus clarus TaxID=94130 RepID=A0A8H3M2A3_9GLOM|nr:hypothetical protein RCL_jg9700.t3 [Rhizophagus clarus]